MQIYKEVIFDLLTGEKNLKIKESPSKGIHVEGLTEVYIDSLEDFLELVDYSHNQRVVANTKLNNFSSRSHSIFILEITQNFSKNYSKKGTLYLVDLAGSEKVNILNNISVSKTGAIGEILEEAKKINLSLSALGNVIYSLTSNSDHIPYRDSKLTRILQESLGGNNKTTLIVNCSPYSSHIEETMSTLKFAQRVKTIKNKAIVNIKLSYEEMQRNNSHMKKEIEDANNEIFQLKELLARENDFRKMNNSSSHLRMFDKTNVTQILEKFDGKSNFSLENDVSGKDNLNLNKSNEIKIINLVNNEIKDKIRNNCSENMRNKGNVEEIHLDDIINDLNISKIDENKEFAVKMIRKQEKQIKSLEKDLKERDKKILELEESNKFYKNKNLELNVKLNIKKG